MSQPTVLIVEDDVLACEAMRDLIRLHVPNVVVMCCPAVDKALQIVNSHPADVAIVDMRLPATEDDLHKEGESNGYDVLNYLKKQSPRTQVIVHTAYGSIENSVRCMRSGAFDYIQKGTTSPDDILRSVRHALALSMSTRDRDTLTERLILSDWEEIRKSADSHKKGIALESLASLLFRSISGWDRIEGRVRTKTEEIDLVILNESVEDFWKRFGSLILVECKNWWKSARPGRSDFDAFYAKVQRRGHKDCRLGFFISLNGVAQTFDIELDRIAKEATVIVTLDGEALWRMICADNRSRFLKELVVTRLVG